MTLSNGWYKGSIPFYEITEVSVAVSGNGVESWESDGLVCYRSGTKVTIVCDNMTAIGERAFFKFLDLKKVSGLGAVTTIGAYAFCYTPNIEDIDIVPGNLSSIGVSAFRMSSAEDALDLSSVSLSIVGDMATRYKRWDASTLSAVQGVAFPRTILLEVPNPDSQLKYSNIPNATKDGKILYTDATGCTALMAYHVWNCLNAGTPKQYGNWLDWYNDTLNKDGRYAEINHHDDQTRAIIFERLGWLDNGYVYASGSQQLQTILNRLVDGVPTYASMHSTNTQDGYHAVAVVGCDAIRHKLAVVDSSVLDDVGVISWISFEDLFVGGADELDGIHLIDYNRPVLAPNSTWFKQGSKTEITQIDIKDTYEPAGTAVSWDASVANNGSIMAHIEGTKLTLSGNGSGKISLNPDSTSVFADFSSMKTINGGNILDVSKVTNATKMFNGCSVLESVDVSNWNTGNITLMHTMFQKCFALVGINTKKWDTGNVTSMLATFNQCMALKVLDVSSWDVSKVTTMQNLFASCRSLESLDLSNWDVGNVANMASMFKMIESDNCQLVTIGNVSDWNTSKVSNMSAMFQGCKNIKGLDLSKWKTNACTNMQNLFYMCYSLEELNLANWDTVSCANLGYVFTYCDDLKKITLGEKFSFTGTGSAVATLPTPVTGNWYDVHGNAIAPADVPDQMYGVYYATPEIAEEDMSGMVLVKKKNLMRTAAAIRTTTGNGKAYAHDDFADALLESVT